ncbi:MAG: magnesium/cobalt transporter CorA [Syntrophobacterales bacterium]|nr:magnesium/cobalt transporter CorA [Syntrophobacterales bacterium]
MPKLLTKSVRQAGLPPGTLVYTGEPKDAAVKVTITHYDEATITDQEYDAFSECLPPVSPQGVTWIDVRGVHQVKNLEKLGECFHLHPLVLEDILDVEQRPKIEDYDDYLFIVLKTIRPFGSEGMASEQISLILGANYLISCHEVNGDIFAPVRERLLTSKGRIRKLGADYLAYSLIDLIVDNYFVHLDSLGDQVESLEDQVVTRPSPQTLREVHQFKNDMIMVRKCLWPLREVIARLERRESPLINDSLTVYFKDVYDHTIIAIETVETYRDILSGMLDIYLSSMSNKLNEIMKVLTIIATIFMPLTFITSLYGMNFKNMPELRWRYGYYEVLGLIVVIALGMLLYFRKRRWI